MEELIKSIAHWENNLQLVRKKNFPVIGSAFCDCCRVFIKNNCKRCPVKLYTKASLCRLTPYFNVYYLINYKSTDPDFWKDLERAVEEEIQFLKKVLEAQLCK